MQFFEDGVKASYKSYFTDGARSKKKLFPLHGGIAQCYRYFIDLMASDPASFDIIAEGYNSNDKEHNAPSLTGTKNIDIAVLHGDKFIISNSVKFVTSNYGQNANNYIENAIGETVNLRLGKGNEKLVCAYTFIIAWQRPYLKKDKSVGRIENLSSKSIEMYRVLSNSTDIFPDHLIFSTIDTANSQYFVKDSFIDWTIAGVTDISFPKSEKEYTALSPEKGLKPELIDFLNDKGNVAKQVIATLEDAFTRNGIAFHPDWNARKLIHLP